MNLYQDLSTVYHEMYQNLFDYDKEFTFYHTTLTQFAARKMVEFGCGTGNLAKRFLDANFDYLGVDLNQEMLDIAAQSLPKEHFHQSDMRDFQSNATFDAALITGRTISYLTTHQDMLKAFDSMHHCLKDGGLLVFDAIDASLIFENFDEREQELNVAPYKRLSHSTPNLQTGWTWDWECQYFEEKNGAFEAIGNDSAIIRAFTIDELTLLLKLSGFELLEVIAKDVYAWKSDYFLARKV
ncbi:MAG: class I SAM-dependent methyltransferase [Chitinophagales bacterium]